MPPEDSAPAWIEQLSAPIRSFRLIALEQAISQGDSADCLAGLRAARESEQDEECLLLFEHALRTVQERIRTGSGATRPSGGNDVSGVAADGQPSIVPEDPDGLAWQDFLNRTALWEKTALLRSHGPAWVTSHPREMAELLSAPFLSLRLAALDAFQARDPKLLTDHLPSLLRAQDPGLRVSAVKALLAVDCDEAMAHLDAMLCDPDENCQLAGLSLCLLLPVEQVQGLLLNFLAATKSMSLLEKAGYSFQINPLPGAPYRLLELAETSGPQKARFLREIAEGSCRVIRNSRILGAGFDVWFTRVRTWVRQRQFRKVIQAALQGIARKPFPAALSEFSEHVQPCLAQPGFREVLLAAVSWPMAKPARQVIEVFLAGQLEMPEIPSEMPWAIPSEMTSVIPSESPSKRPEDKLPEKPPEISPEIPPEELVIPADPLQKAILDMAGLSADAPPGENCKHLAEALNIPGLDDRLRLAVIRNAIRLDLDGFQPQCRDFLKSGSEPLVAVAIEYLARFSPDDLFLHIGTWLLHPSDRIRGAAAKVFSQADPAAAASALAAMLKDPNEGARNAALSCLIHLDFSLIREAVVETLPRLAGEEAFEQLLCLFHANPDPDNLFPLYLLEHSLPPKEAACVREVRLAAADLLGRFGRLSDDELTGLEGTLAEKSAAWRAKRARPAPAYSLRAIRRLKQEEPTLWQSMQQTIAGHRTGFFLMLAFMLFATGLNLWLAFFSTSTSGPASVVPSTPLELRGKVVKLDRKAGEFVVQSPNGARFALPIDANLNEEPREGMSFLGNVNPYLETRPGCYAARVIGQAFLSLEKPARPDQTKVPKGG